MINMKTPVDVPELLGELSELPECLNELATLSNSYGVVNAVLAHEISQFIAKKKVPIYTLLASRAISVCLAYNRMDIKKEIYTSLSELFLKNDKYKIGKVAIEKLILVTETTLYCILNS